MIADSGLLEDMPLDLAKLLVIEADEVQIQFNTLLHAAVTESFCDAIAVNRTTEVFADFQKVILAVGVMHMRQQF